MAGNIPKEEGPSGRDYHFHQQRDKVDEPLPRRFLHALAVTGARLKGKKSDLKGAWKEVKTGVHVERFKVDGPLDKCHECCRRLLLPLRPHFMPGIKELSPAHWSQTYFCTPSGVLELSGVAIDDPDRTCLVTDLVEYLKEQDLFTPIVESRQRAICKQREQTRPIIATDRETDPRKERICSEVEACQHLDRAQGGAGGAYFIKNDFGQILYVIKPNDEDISTLHNCKGAATPFVSVDQRVRVDIPTYLSAVHETLSSDIAQMCGFEHVVPPTALVIKQSDRFHVATDSTGIKALETCYEKLCSAQAFIPDARELADIGQRLGDSFQFHQPDYEETNIHVWVIGDKDCHAGNFLVHSGNRLVKIDNGLAFGYNRRELVANSLCDFKQSSTSLSPESIKKIQEIPIDRITARMERLGISPEAIASLRGRVDLLQKFVIDNPRAAIIEIDKYMDEHYEGKP